MRNFSIVFSVVYAIFIFVFLNTFVINFVCVPTYVNFSHFMVVVLFSCICSWCSLFLLVLVNLSKVLSKIFPSY